MFRKRVKLGKKDWDLVVEAVIKYAMFQPDLSKAVQANIITEKILEQII